MNIANVLKGLRSRQGSAKAIVISGDYGKTTTATLLKAILEGSGKRVSSILLTGQMSANELKDAIAVGRQEVEYSVIEVEPDLLQHKAVKGLRVDCLVLTTSVPVESWKSLSVQHLVAPEDIKVSNYAVESYQRVAVGSTDKADARIEEVKLYRRGTEVVMIIDHQTRLELAIGLSGQMAARNLVTSVAAAYVLGIDVHTIQEAIADLEPLSGRFEYIGKVREVAVFIDRSVQDESRRLAIGSARELTKRRLIIGIDATTASSQQLDEYEAMADRFITTSPGRDGSAASVKGMIERALRAGMKDDVVLLIAPDISRSSVIVDELEEKQ